VARWLNFNSISIHIDLGHDPCGGYRFDPHGRSGLTWMRNSSGGGTSLYREPLFLRSDHSVV